MGNVELYSVHTDVTSFISIVVQQNSKVKSNLNDKAQKFVSLLLLLPLHLAGTHNFLPDFNLLPGDPLAPPLHHNKSDPVTQCSKPTIETEYLPGLSCREF